MPTFVRLASYFLKRPNQNDRPVFKNAKYIYKCTEHISYVHVPCITSLSLTAQ